MIYTVSEARPLLAPFVDSGSCPSAQAVLDKINECSRRLMAKATWWNMLRRIRFYTTGGIIALPEEVEKILSVDTEGVPARAFGPMYEFLENGPGEVPPRGGVDRNLIDLGDGWPTFFDIPPTNEDTTTDGGPCRLVALSTQAADIGLSLTLWGRDSLLQDVSATGSPLAIARWQNGVEGSFHVQNVLDTPGAYPEQSYATLTSVAKPVTAGHVSLYTYEPTTHRMYFLAKYGPLETRPGYRRYRILCPGLESASNVLCLCRLRYVPRLYDTDPLLIQNLDSLKLMAMAIREENDRNLQLAVQYEQSATRLLGEEQRTKQNNDVIIQIVDGCSLGGVGNLV